MGTRCPASSLFCPGNLRRLVPSRRAARYKASSPRPPSPDEQRTVRSPRMSDSSGTRIVRFRVFLLRPHHFPAHLVPYSHG